MHKEIRGTDLQWLAEGWWRHYFKHRRLSKITAHIVIGAPSLILGGILLLAGFAAVILALPDTPPVSPPASLPTWGIVCFVIAAVTILLGLVLSFKAQSIERREEDKFIDYVIDAWEAGNQDIPDIEMIAEYLKQQELHHKGD